MGQRTMIGRVKARSLGCGVLAAVLLSVAGASGCASTERFQRAASEDERAEGDRLASAMIAKLGGAEAYDALGYVAFDFTPRVGGVALASQRHEWDKHNGFHKLIKTDGEHTIEVYTDLWDKYVEVYEDNKRITDAARVDELGDEAYKSFINDSYWLVAPYKAFDPGVSRAAVPGGVRLSFGSGIGLTSGDVYILELDEDANLTGWSFLLESGVSASLDFKNKKVINGVTFFNEKTMAAGGIDFGTIVGATSTPAGTFAPLRAHRRR